MCAEARAVGAPDVKLVVGGIIGQNHEQIVVARRKRTPLSATSEKKDGDRVLCSNDIVEQAHKALIFQDVCGK